MQAFMGHPVALLIIKKATRNTIFTFFHLEFNKRIAIADGMSYKTMFQTKINNLKYYVKLL